MALAGRRPDWSDSAVPSQLREDEEQPAAARRQQAADMRSETVGRMEHPFRRLTIDPVRVRP